MANNELRPADVEFAQFTAALISQTLDAIIAAHLEQEGKVRKLEETAGLDLVHFREEVVPLSDVESELAWLFPIDEPTEEQPHGVVEDSPYQPAVEGQEEDPPIYQLTGYQMQGEKDWGEAQGIITREGYKAIRDHVRSTLVRERRANMLEMLRRGVPRIVVDQGRINARLTFQYLQAGETDNTGSFLQSARERITGLPQSAMPFSLRVKPAQPQMHLAVNVVGEVELTFKTIG